MIVDHKFYRGEPVLPESKLNNALYTYFTASNGLFIYARRPGLEVLLPIVQFREPVRGLDEITPFVDLWDRVPLYILRRMLTESRRSMPNERLFYLANEGQWILIIPEQVAGQGTVRAVKSYESLNVLMEVHSHNSMPAFFSGLDNQEETGFRIYAVLGRVGQEQPEISVRVGVYGHFLPVKMDQIFGGKHGN